MDSAQSCAAGQVTVQQMSRYCDLIYRVTGIRIPAIKKTLVSNRVRRRLRHHGLQDFEAYYNLLSRLRADDPEWDAFLQEITTHETFLFRDEAQWEWFQTTYLPECCAEARSGKRPRRLRIWSAACSTGDEPYTIACCIAGCVPDHEQWKIEILATDIGVGALKQARAGVFGERAMRLVPPRYKKSFFVQATACKVWQAKPALGNWITFRQHNLLHALRQPPFDLVFLKNVLIYFDADSKKRVLEHVRAQLRPGARLVAGAAEGIAEHLRDFCRLHAWLFRLPPSGEERANG